MRRLDIVPRTLARLRADGWTAEVVERGGRWGRKDLFGIADVLAVRRGETLAVQVAGPGEGPAHVRKIAEAEAVGAVREAGWQIEVWAWSRVKVVLKDGRKGRARRWKVEVTDVS